MNDDTRSGLFLLLAIAVLIVGVGTLAYLLGLNHGRTIGYRMCLGEQDDDRPRYAVGGRGK